MKVEFETWIKLIYIDPEIPLRGGQSKHQRKILEIFNKIEDLDLEGLLETQYIDCTGGTEIVAYCRYLLHCLDVLKDEGA